MLSTYAEWNKILDVVASHQNDAQALDLMKRGTIEWQSGVAERFSKKFLNVINGRIDRATDKFQTEMKRSGGQDRNIVNALLLLRKEFRYLYELCSIDALRPQDKAQFQQIVLDAADQVQESLEDSAKKSDRTGKLGYLIRNNRVNAI